MITLRVDCFVDCLPSLELLGLHLTLVFPHLAIEMIHDYDNDYELVLAYIQIQIIQVREYPCIPAPDHQNDPSLWSIYDFLS